MSHPNFAEGPNAKAFTPRVVIIGAGMSGILACYKLLQEGINDVVVYEKGASVGGTWRENDYPGLHCDVPSHHYCYSFALNPSWSKEYSPGHEIRAYFEKTAVRLGVTQHIQFNSQVVDAKWIDDRWHVRLLDGTEDVADIIISATGILHVPAYPSIPGLQDFKGVSFHTTRWDKGLDLRDKRIGLIGTGSTAVQIVAELAGKVDKLTVFQRTAQWVARSPNLHFPWWKRIAHQLFPSMVRKRYADAMVVTRAVTDGIMGTDVNASKALASNIEENLASVRDPELRAKLTPDYAIGCKRLVASPNFYEAIQHPSCELVIENIDHIEARGIVTQDERLHELDVLVLATGFDPSAYARPMTLSGRDGKTLDEVWSKRPIAYHSIGVPDMPNFFMIGGPFSPVGNISIILMSEWQVEYILKCVRVIREQGVAMSPRGDVTDQLIDSYRDAAKDTVWATGGCRSWYLDADGVPQIYPYTPTRFREETRADPVLDDYELIPLTH